MFIPDCRRLHGQPGSCLFFFFNDPATTEIYTLSLHDALPIFGRDTEPPHHFVVHDDTSAAGDRTHGQLLMAGYAELAYEENVERHSQGPGHFGRHRHAAPRETNADDVVASRVLTGPLGQHAACL